MHTLGLLSLWLSTAAIARPLSEGPAHIVNGDAETGFPSAVSMGMAFGDYRQSTCTGSLIAPHIVLTAAHCTQEYVKMGVPENAIREIGRIFLAPDIEDGREIEFDEFINHPKYDGIETGMDLPKNDYGVVILAEPVQNVEPVWFNTEPLEADVVGTRLVSVGYGVTSGAGQTGSGLRRSTPIRISGLDGQFILSDTDDNPGEGNVCSGDSGGPQYRVNEDGSIVQWSIHSFADQYCVQMSGSSRTDKAADWILEQVHDVYGTTDHCVFNGLYFDNKCDMNCPTPDPACGVAGLAPWADGDGEDVGACSQIGAPGGFAAALGALLLRTRRRAR